MPLPVLYYTVLAQYYTGTGIDTGIGHVAAKADFILTANGADIIELGGTGSLTIQVEMKLQLTAWVVQP